jgi:hypothetical protein
MNNGKLKFPILSKKNTLAYFVVASEAKNKSYTILMPDFSSSSSVAAALQH